MKRIAIFLFFSPLICMNALGDFSPEVMKNEFIQRIIKLQVEQKSEKYAKMLQKIANKDELAAALNEGAEGLKKLSESAQAFFELIKQDPDLQALIEQEVSQVNDAKDCPVVVDEAVRKKLERGEPLDGKDIQALQAAINQVNMSKRVDGTVRAILFAAAAIDALDTVAQKRGGRLAEFAHQLAQVKQEIAERISAVVAAEFFSHVAMPQPENMGK